MSRLHRFIVMSVAAALLAATTQAQPASEPVPATMPATASAPAAMPSTASAPASAPATSPAKLSDAASAPATKPARSIYLQYANMPFNDVVRQFVEKAVKKPILGDYNIEGTLNFHDSEPYSYEEAFDTLNLLLSMRGHVMQESGRFIMIKRLDQAKPKYIDNATSQPIRASELVTTVLPLKYIDSKTAARAATEMSKQASIAELPKGKGILITDRMENITYIRTLLSGLDTGELADQQLKTYVMKKAPANGVADIVNSLFGPNRPRRMVFDREHNRFLPDPNDTGEFVTANSDPRTNMLFLIGSGDKLAMVEQMVEKLDSDAPLESGEVRIFELKNARAEEVANTIRQLQPGTPQMPPSGKGRPVVPPRVVHDSATNCVIASATIDQMATIERLIKDIDSRTVSRSGAKLFKLESADAQQLAPIIQNAGVKRDATGRTISNITVGVEPRSNTLIVSGNPTDIEEAGKLITELDRKDASKDSREIRVIQLKAGDARQLADSLKRLFEQQGSGRSNASSLRVEADSATNSLIVAAGPADWPVIQDILKKLEASVAPTAVATTKIIPLKNAKAGELAQTLRTAYSSGPRNPSRSGNVSPQAVITSSDRTNCLLISACDADHQCLTEMITMLDVPLPDTGTPAAGAFDPVIVMQLKSADASRLAQTLQTLIPRTPGQEVVISADPANTSLMIRAPEVQRKMIQELVAKVDAESSKTARVMKRVQLKGASAQSLAQMLSQLYQNVDNTQRTRRGGPDPAEMVIVTAAPDDRTLVVDAPQSKIDAIVELATAMDLEYSPSKVEVKIYQLSAGNAGEIAPTLSRLFTERQGQKPRGTQNAPEDPAPKFEIDAGSNRLLVAATARQFETIDKLVLELDKDSAKAGGAQIVKLKNGDAQVLAAIITSAASRRDQRGSLIPGLSVNPDVRTNSLVIAGSAGDVQTALKLVELLDTPVETSAATVQIVKINGGDAVKMAQVLQTMIPPPQRGQAQDTFVTADSNTNSILLRAPDSQRKMLLDMISNLDKATLDDARLMQVVSLKGASAQGLSAMLSQFYQNTGSAHAPRPGQPQANPAEAVILSAAPDDRTLVVEAPKRKMDEVLKLIENLDGEIAPMQQEVRIYQLANANASDIGPTLGRLFADSPSRRPGQQQTGAAEPQPRVEIDSGNNRLLVSATARQYETIDKLIAELDKASARLAGAQIVKLKNADAGSLSNIVANAASRRDARGQIVPGLSVSADLRTNSLVVAGVAGDVQTALKLIESMDVPTAEGADQIQIVQLKTSDASRLAQTLQSMIPPPSPGKPQEVFIQADPTNSVLLIRAPQSQRKLLEEMIAKLDGSQDVVREMRTVKLKGSSAQALAAMLSQLYQNVNATASRRGGNTGQAADSVIVTAAPDDRTLVIDAPHKKIEDVVKMASELDMELMPTAMQIRTYTMQNASASEMAPSLARLFAEQRSRQPGQSSGSPEPQPRFEADSSTNQLLVAATLKQFETIEDLIKKLNSTATLDSQTKTFRLKFARASNVVSVLQTMLTDSTARKGQPDMSSARVAALADGNAVVVQGLPQKLALAEQLIQTLDSEDGAGMSIQIVPLKNAQAKTLADAINQSLSQQRTSSGARPNEPDVTVTPELNSNSLLVRGPADRMQAVMEMVKKLDGEGIVANVQVRTFHLANSDALELAKSVEKFFKDMGAQTRKGSGEATPFSVSADSRTNTIFVSTTPANFTLLENLIKDLDQSPDRAARDAQYFWLVNADPTDVASKVTAMYADRKGPDKPVVEADIFTNAVTVIAKDADLKSIEQVIGRLDEQAKGTNVRVRVIPLTQVRADRMADVLRRVYGQMTDAQIEVTVDKGISPAPLPKDEGEIGKTLFPEALPPEVIVATSLPASMPSTSTAPADPSKPKVVIAVDRVSNSLIISATRQDIENIQALVDQLANTSDKETDFKVFTVKNADPAMVARMLNDLFNPKPTFVQGAGGQPGTPGGRGGRGAPGTPGTPPQTPVQPAQVVPGGPPTIMAVADIRTKSLFVRAKPLDFEVIEAVIKTLDQKALVTTEVKVFIIKNADATEVANNIRDLFAAASSSTSGRGRSGATPPGAPGIPNDVRAEMVRQMVQMQLAGGMTTAETSNMVTVSANRNTNTVVVAASTAEMELITRIIQELDQTAEKTRTPSVRMYALKQAEVAPAVTALQQIFSASGARGGGRGAAGAGASADPQVVITGDEASRMIVVSALPDKHELIAKVIKDLDEATGTDPMLVKVYRLQHADTNSVATALLNMVGDTARTPGQQPRRGGGASAGTGLTRISADPSSSSLVVRATKEEHDRIAKLLVEIDVLPGSQWPIQTIPLTNADATNVAGILNRLFGAQAPTRGGRAGQPAMTPGQTVLIEGDKDSRLLTVRADDETFQKIRAVAAQLDAAPPAGAFTTTVLALKNSQAVTVAAVLQQAFAQPRTGPGARPNADEAVTIVGEPFSNSVVVTANARKTQQVAALLEKLDVETDAGAKTEFLILKNAKAADLANALSKFATGAGAPGAGGPRRVGGGSGQSGVTLSADTGSNSLIFSGPSVEVEKMMKLAMKLDDSSQGGALETKIISLKNAQAASVAPAISQAFAPAKGAKPAAEDTVTAVAENGSNTVLVTASAANMKKVEALVAQIDSDDTPGIKTEFYVLKNAKATDLAGALSKVLATSGVRTRGGAAAAQQGVLIAAEPSSNSIVVSGPSNDLEKVRKIVEEMDRSSLTSGMETKLVTLKNAQAATVAPALTAAYVTKGKNVAPEDAVTVVAEPNSNSVVVTANAMNMKKVEDLLAKIDSVEDSGMKTEIVILQNAKAVDLATVLTRIASNTMRGAGGGPGGRGAANQPQAVVSGDAGSNALVFSGPAQDLDKLVALAHQIDLASTASTPGVYTIQLKNGDAVATAAMVKDLFAQSTKGAKQPEPFGVTADERANALVLATSKEMYEKVSEWVSKLEDMKPARGNLRLIPIPNADPTEVDKAIRQMYNAPATPGSSGAGTGPRRGGGSTGAGGASTGGTGKVDTTVLAGQKALLVNANDEDYAEIMALIKKMEDAAVASKRDIKIFTLKNASNTKVAAALDQMYKQLQPKTPTAADLVTVQALAQTNAVVVAAGKDKMAEISALIEQLDKQENSPQVEYRIFPLANASPTKILPTLQQMIAPMLKIRPEEPITVQADERTRSIIVSGRANAFDQISKIIESLDKAPAPEMAKTDVIFIQLKHADAKGLATVLMDMLKPDAAGQITPEAKMLQEQIRLLNIKAGAEDQIPQLDLNKPIKISSDPGAQGSNTLIVSSTPDNLKAMRAIVETLDVVPIADGIVLRLVHLQNSDAASLTTILKDIFSQGQQLAGRKGTSIAGKAEPDSTTGKGLVNQLNISADLRTNTLVLSGVQETIALAEVLIKDLDRDESKFVTEVKLFKLKNADAVKVLPMLTAVFAETAAVPGAEGIKTQVTRLRTVLDKKQPNESLLPKGRAAMVMQADAATNIIIVAARNDMMPLIADIIQSIDIPGAGSLNTVRIFPLESADATRLAAVVAALYTGPNANNVRAEDKPTVTVDTRTNAVIVASSDKTFLLLEGLLKKLDAKLPVDLRDIKILPLKNAESDTMAVSLQKMMDARVQRLSTMSPKESDALKVIILSDARSNSLLVGGSAEGFEIVKSLSEQLDGASPALSGQVQIFPLTNGNAGNIAQTLTNLFNQRYQAATSKDIQRQKPIILADLRTNALLVACNEDDSKVLKGLLERLDVKLLDPTVQLVLLPLKYNDAGTVGTMIRTIFASRLTSMTPAGTVPDPTNRVDVAADPLSNSLIVSASKDNVELIKGLLAKVDLEPPTESGVVKIYVLKVADATATANLLQGLIRQGLYKPSITSATNNPAVAAREKVSIVSDIRTNTIIVSASKENMAIIEQIMKELDTDVAALMGDVRIYTLTKADSTKLAPMLQQFFSSKRQGELSVNNQLKTVPVTVVADARTNSLLVTGGKESFAAVEEMIKKLDGDMAASINDFKVFYLKNATAAIVQPMLQQLFAQRPARPGTAKDPVTIVADPKNNALVVGATVEDMQLAEGLIAKLDVPETNGAAVQVFALKKANAATLVTTIKSLMAAQGTTAPNAPGLAISSDDRTNSIIVSAGAADMDRIKELVAKLDQDTVAKVSEIRVYPLQNADAKELAQILTDVLTSKPKSVVPENPNRQSLLQFITRTQGGKDLISSALQEGVTITTDLRTNALIIAAPLESMPLLDSLVKALDQTSPRIAEIRMFTLQNADATQMANVLSQMFRLQASNQPSANGTKSYNYTLTASQPSNGNSNGNDVPDQSQQANGSPSAPMGNAEQSALTVTVDIRTNNLLVGGTRQYVELASKVIEELDSSPAQERRSEVYRLRNARANDVQTALQAFLDREKQKVAQTLGPSAVGAAQRLLEHEVAVVAVPSENKPENSNTLLLSASPRYFDVVKKIIQELDQPPPQVLIQVLLAEITLDNTCDLGMDAMFTHASGDNNISYGTDFRVGAEIKKLNSFSVSVTGSDFNFFLRALATQGKLEVLSRPMVLGSDNQTASINIGDEVAFITDSRINENGTTFNQVQYRPVGISLTVTPRVNPDGLVKLDVNPRISALSNSSVTISPGVNAPIINTREAKTTVSVQDGHTIVLGGLIQTKDENREDKVPFFGDMPLLGNLFKKTQVVKQRRELLIVMTPHVVRNVEGVDCQTKNEIDRLNRVLQKSNLQEIQKQLNNGNFNTATCPAQSTEESSPNGSSNAPFITGWPTSQPATTKIIPVEVPN